MSQWCLDLLCPTKTDPLKFFFNLLLMRIATRERYLEDGNNTFVCIYHTQREGSFSFSFFFKPSPHSESDYCRTQKKKCSFMAKFILKLKVCKCSKYNKLLIYMSLLTQAQLWVSWRSSSFTIDPHFSRCICSGGWLGSRCFSPKHELQLACQAFKYWQSLDECLDFVTGCYGLELMNIY